MSKAKEAMEKLDEREDGITDEEEINLNEMRDALQDIATSAEAFLSSDDSVTRIYPGHPG